MATNNNQTDPVIPETSPNASVTPDPTRSAAGNNIMSAERIAQIKAEADRRRAAAEAAGQQVSQTGGSTDKRSQYMAALSNDMVYRKALDMYNKASWRGGLKDEDYQWLYDNRGAITQAALSKHGGQNTAGFMNDRMIQTLRFIGSGQLGKNVVKQPMPGQAPANAAPQETLEERQARGREWWRQQRGQTHGQGGNEGAQTDPNAVAVAPPPVEEPNYYPAVNPAVATTSSAQGGQATGRVSDQVAVELLKKGGGTGPYNGKPVNPGQNANGARIVRGSPFAATGRPDNGYGGNKGMEQKGGPGPDPNIGYTDSSSSQINSQRAGSSGNRRFTPFSGNMANNKLRGG